MPQDVFISYSHTDAETTAAIAERLERDGISCWYAPRDIGPGDEWASAIMKALNACRIMVLVFSDASNASVQVLREVNNAVSAGKTIIPFKITENGPTDAMQYYLATLHWLDANGRPLEKSLDDLYERVQNVLDGEEDDYEVEIPGETKRQRRKRRRKKRGFFSFLFGIPAIILNAIFGAIMLFTFCELCGYKNSTAVGLMALFLGSLTLLIFQVTRLVNKPITKYHWLICVGILLVITGVAAVMGSGFDKHLPPTNIPDNGPEVSMNAMNHSMAIRSEDGTVVYFCHNERDEAPCIRRCTYEEFLAGEMGEELVGGVWTDNLALVGDSYLAFRDYSNNKMIMKLLDLETGSVRVLKTRECYEYYAGENEIYYGENTASSNSLGVITLDGKYDGDYFDQNLSSSWIFFYNRDVYYVNTDGFLQNSRTGTLPSKRMNRFLIYDGVIYYCGIDGGLYRAPLNDAGSAEKLCGDDIRSMVICREYLYYLSDTDNGYLYRIPVEGGEPELILQKVFNDLNVIGDCLYLCNYAENYERLNVNDLP